MGLFDPSSVDAALGGVSAFDPSAWTPRWRGASAFDPSSVDSALSAASSAALPAAEPPDPTTLADLYGQFIYEPVHTWDQEWIAGTTFLGNPNRSVGQRAKYVLG